MRSLPDSEMGDLVPQGGVHSDKTTDEKKQMERQLEEDEGAEYYVRNPKALESDDRISKSLLPTTPPRVVEEFPRDLTTCTLKLISILESRVYLAFLCVA